MNTNNGTMKITNSFGVFKTCFIMVVIQGFLEEGFDDLLIFLVNKFFLLSKNLRLFNCHP